MAPPRPKALSGITGEELIKSTSSDTINISMEKLLEERRHLEQYTQEQHDRLNRLREMIKEEKASAAAELEKRRQELGDAQTDKLRLELEQLRRRLAECETTATHLRAERDSAQRELQQLRKQVAQQQDSRKLEVERDAALGELQRLRQEMKEEATRLDRELATERRRASEEKEQAAGEIRRLQQMLQQLEQSRSAVAAQQRSVEEKAKELHLLEAELREKQTVSREWSERERQEILQERIRLARRRQELLAAPTAEPLARSV